MIEREGLGSGLSEEEFPIQVAAKRLPEGHPYRRRLLRWAKQRQFQGTMVSEGFFEQIENGELDVGYVYNTLFAGRGTPPAHCSADVLGPRACGGMMPKGIVTPRRARNKYKDSYADKRGNGRF